jgi:hypothetical protein
MLLIFISNVLGLYTNGLTLGMLRWGFIPNGLTHYCFRF